MNTVARSFAFLVLALVGAVGSAQAQKVPMDHDVYEIWDTIGGQTLSPDGAWALYSLIGYDRDGELRVRSTRGETEHAFERAVSASFDEDSRFVVFRIQPSQDARREAQRERRRGNDAPADTLGILELRTGEVARVPGMKSFRTPERAGGWVAYLLRSDEGEGSGEATKAGDEDAVELGRSKDAGSPLILRELATGTERRFESVTDYAFSRDGERLAFVVSTEDAIGDGVFVVDVAGGEPVTALAGPGEYKRLVWDEAGEQLGFLTSRDDAESETPSFALYHWRSGVGEAMRLAAEGEAGVPEGWWVSEHGSVRFSRDGERIFFGTAPRPAPAQDDDGLLPKERVDVEIWHWEDPLIQPMQKIRKRREERRTFEAVAHLREGRVVQLADESMPEVRVGSRGDANVAIGVANEPYAQMTSYDTPGYADYYLVDVYTAEREIFREQAQGVVRLSPESNYAYWYNPQTLAWYALGIGDRRLVELTDGLRYPVYNEDEDRPQPPSAYGTAGWTEGDREFLIYDRYDVWALDPSGDSAPRSITGGVGREEGLRLRVVTLDREREAIDPGETLLLSAFDAKTKQAGFYRARVEGRRAPERLVMMDRAFSMPRKAKDADVVLYERSSFEEFGDLWVASLDFSDARQISEANPWQSEYRWGTAELMEWNSTDGLPLQGIVYKPEDFDSSKEYPLLVYFYERMSDLLHEHYEPIPHRSRINPTFMTSRGYVVFIPDIVYKIGYPGESAMNSVMPGVLKLLEDGYIDRDRIGVQGHSWGGYQIAYMVTRTDLFRAGGAGAPVANMTSAYGGIRWQTGMSRQFQYERTQSRIGGTLWEMPMRYLENSPLFWLDKVDTPLLIMHNDQDGAVPWYQGIELYMGLRRLGKPAWLVNYNDEPHWPTTAANKRDWNIRMQQFFDYYLLDAPAPVWLAEGIPATEKGKTLGYELLEEVVTDGEGTEDGGTE